MKILVLNDGKVGLLAKEKLTGLDGSQGPIGLSGLDGLKGEQGIQGFPGKDGTDGTNGQNGVDGISGPQGDQGPQGPAGPQGPQGETGPQGNSGRDGLDGRDGTPGKDGSQGPQGQSGVSFYPPRGGAEGAFLTLVKGEPKWTQPILGGLGQRQRLSKIEASISSLQAAAPSSGGGGLSFVWNYTADANDTNPSLLSIRYMMWANATQTAARTLYLAHINASDLDVDAFFLMFRIGDRMLVQDANNSANFMDYVITDTPTVLVQSFSTFPVSLTNASGTGSTGFANNHGLFVAMLGGGGGSTGTGVDSTFTSSFYATKVSLNAQSVAAAAAYQPLGNYQAAGFYVNSNASYVDSTALAAAYQTKGFYANSSDVSSFYALKTSVPATASFANSSDVSSFYALNTSIVSSASISSTYVSKANGASATIPSGRLSISPTLPVVTADITASNTAYYQPYNGNVVPLFSGSAFFATAFGVLPNKLSDASSNPAAVTSAAVYDLFVYLNGSNSPTLVRGALWSSTTSRGAAQELVRLNGILVNTAAITNGPAFNLATYLGTIATDANAQVNFMPATAAVSGGTASKLHVWNYYNRCVTAAQNFDAFSGWTASSTDMWQLAHNTAGNAFSYVSGIAEDSVNVAFAWKGLNSNGNGLGAGVGLDNTSKALDGTESWDGPGANVWAGGVAMGLVSPQLGLHTLYLLNWAGNAGVTSFFGNNTSINSHKASNLGARMQFSM